MKNAVVTLLIALSLTTAAAHASSAPTPMNLDGKTFEGQLGNRKKKTKDELSFKDGKFTSVATQQQGFGPTDYKTKPAGRKVTFDAVATNEKGDRMEWHGIIKGPRATARATRIQANGKTEIMRYQGTLKDSVAAEGAPAGR